MPICAVCEVRLEGYFFCRKKVRIFDFHSRVRRVYFGGGYFHHRNRSSEIAAVWCVFSTFLFAYFRSGDKPPQWRENFACNHGCIGGKVRYSCAVRYWDLRTDSTPALLFSINVACHSPFFVPVGFLSDWSIIVTG